MQTTNYGVSKSNITVNTNLNQAGSSRTLNNGGHGQYRGRKLDPVQPTGSHVPVNSSHSDDGSKPDSQSGKRARSVCIGLHKIQKTADTPCSSITFPSIEEELRAMYLSPIEKKNYSSMRSYTRISHLPGMDGSEIKLINSLTESQVNRYFGPDFTIKGWPEIKPYDRKSIVPGKGGHFAKIKMAELKGTKHSELVAVKKIYSRVGLTFRGFSGFRENFLLEACLQQRAKPIAPNVYGIAIRSDPKKNCYKAYIAMELIKAPTLYAIQSSLSCKEKKAVFCKIAEYVCELHKKNIYLGDLRDRNILVNQEKKHIHIIDYGFSQDLRHSITIRFDPNTVAHYHAPEVYLAAHVHNNLIFDQTGDYYADRAQSHSYLWDYFQIDNNTLLLPTKADIYSLGIILATLFSRMPDDMPSVQWSTYYEPQHLIEFDEQIQRKLKDEQTRKEYRPLITQMLKSDPEQRPDFPAIMSYLEKLS